MDTEKKYSYYQRYILKIFKRNIFKLYINIIEQVRLVTGGTLEKIDIEWKVWSVSNNEWQ